MGAPFSYNGSSWSAGTGTAGRAGITAAAAFTAATATLSGLFVPADAEQGQHNGGGHSQQDQDIPKIHIYSP